MNSVRVVNLEFSWCEIEIKESGAFKLSMCGHTREKNVLRVVFTMGPTSLGYIAYEMHKAMRAFQTSLDAAKKLMRGEGDE